MHLQILVAILQAIELMELIPLITEPLAFLVLVPMVQVLLEILVLVLALDGKLDVTVSSGSVSAVSVISGGSNFDDGETIELANTAIGGGTGSVTLTIKSGGTEDRNTNFYRDIDADTNSPFGPAVAIPSATNQAINFSQSNRAVLGTCNLYFVMETSTSNPMVYKLTAAAFNEASIDFEVDGIATINWSGFAKNITDLQSQGKVSVTTNKTGTLAANQPALTTGCVMLDNTDGFKLGLKTAATASADDFAKDEGVGETIYLYS